jgi:hypothetical protein
MDTYLYFCLSENIQVVFFIFFLKIAYAIQKSLNITIIVIDRNGSYREFV